MEDNFQDSFVIPIFPLPQVVLFAGTFLPLHIFEPRYRDMVNDVLDQRGWLGVPLLKPSGQEEYLKRPPAHEIFGVGEIMHHRRTEDGRFYLLLKGCGRAVVEDWLDDRSYRRAKCRFHPGLCDFNDDELTRLNPVLSDEFNRLATDGATQITQNLPMNTEGGRFEFLFNTLCMACLPPGMRQHSLELDHDSQRLKEFLRVHPIEAVNRLLREIRPEC